MLPTVNLFMLSDKKSVFKIYAFPSCDFGIFFRNNNTRRTSALIIAEAIAVVNLF